MKLRTSITNSACVAACLCCLLVGCEAELEDDRQESDRAEETAEPDSPRLAAVVNGREITTAEVERHLDQLGELYRHSDRTFDSSTRKAKRNRVLQRLIDRELLRDYATRQQIELDSDEVDRKLRERVDRTFETTADFRQFLDNSDMTVSDYRDRIRDELALEAIVEDRVDFDTLDEDRLREYYDRIANRRPADDRLEATRLRIRLSEISDDDYRELRTRLNEELDEIDSASDLRQFQRQIDRWSQNYDFDPRFQTRERHWYVQNQLDSSAADALFETESSRRAPPEEAAGLVDTPMGFDIYWIHERREAGIRRFDEVEELIRDRARRSILQKQRRELVERLRKDADITIHDDAFED